MTMKCKSIKIPTEDHSENIKHQQQALQDISNIQTGLLANECCSIQEGHTLRKGEKQTKKKTPKSN